MRNVKSAYAGSVRHFSDCARKCGKASDNTILDSLRLDPRWLDLAKPKEKLGKADNRALVLGVTQRPNPHLGIRHKKFTLGQAGKPDVGLLHVNKSRLLALKRYPKSRRVAN